MKKKTKYFGWVAIYGDEIHLSKSQIRYALDKSSVIESILPTCYDIITRNSGRQDILEDMLNVIDNCHDDFKFTEKTMESTTTLPFIVESQEFDFETLKKNNSIRTLCGLKVKIDRIIYDITHTTPLAISGTFVVQGVKIRGNWDAFGNPCDFKRC